jgi:hypothetical protein
VPALFAGLGDDARQRLLGFASWTPPGALGEAIAAPAHTAIGRVFIGAAWSAVLVGLFIVSERRLATSIPRSARSARSTRSARDARSVRRPIGRIVRWSCGHGPSGEIAWRSLLLRFRHPRSALETVTGAAIGLAAALTPVLLGDDPGSGAVLVGGSVQLAVLLMAGNSFGIDGAGTAHDVITGCRVADLVDGKRRSIVLVAAPVAVVGPLVAAAASGAWGHLPAGWCIAAAGLLAGTGAAVVQSVIVPIAVPDSDNPFAGGDSAMGLTSALLLAAVLGALTVVTLPVAVALFWASDRGRVGLVTVSAAAVIGVGWALGRLGRRVALWHLARREPEFLAALVPAR